MKPHVHPADKEGWHILHVDQDMEQWLSGPRPDDDAPQYPEPVVLDLGDH